MPILNSCVFGIYFILSQNTLTHSSVILLSIQNNKIQIHSTSINSMLGIAFKYEKKMFIPVSPIKHPIINKTTLYTPKTYPFDIWK